MQGKHKILAVLYKAGEYADNEKFLACTENGLGLKEWLKEQGHEFMVTDDKEGPDSGERPSREVAPDTAVLFAT